MSVTTVVASRVGGPVQVIVEDLDHPQALTGVVRRYTVSWKHERIIGTFEEGTAVNLGTHTDVEGRYFLVDGFVVAVGDNPPSPYRVIIKVVQNSQVLDQSVARQNGRGTVGNNSQRFYHPVQVRFT